MATDLEVGIRYEVTGVEIDAPGAAVLPVARFGSILRESSDATFRIESGNDGTTIRGERSQFKLPSENPQDFPPIAEFGESSYYEISARLFRELIRRTIFATDNESSRYALGGIKLEWKDNVLTAVGTDGRRLAKMDGPAQAVGSPAPFGDVTVVPTRAMQSARACSRRRRQRSPTRHPPERHPRQKPASHDLFATTRRPLPALARRFSRNAQAR